MAAHRIPVSARRLDVYKVALDLVAVVTPLIARIAQHNKKLGQQLEGALPSVAQNICEGLRRTGNDRAHLLTVALGSADEVRCVLDMAAASRMIPIDRAQQAESLADRVCAMTYRLHQHC